LGKNTQHERTLTVFPESGNNFVTITALNGIQDPLALLEALAFVQDCAVALAAFERLQAAKKPG
jgi:hypothetical protein